MDTPPNTPPENEEKDNEPVEKTAKRTARQVLEDIREHGLLGGLGIPGIRQLNALITWTIIGGLAAAGAAVAGYFVHGAIDEGYQDEYKQRLQLVADKSARTCGLDQEKRQNEIFTAVYTDVQGARKQGLLNRIPLVGGWLPSFEWLPGKRLRDNIATAGDNGLSLYPATMADGFKDGVTAVLYNDGSAPTPVLAYRDLGNGAFDRLMDALNSQGGIKSGTLVLAWNKTTDEYEIIPAAPGQTTVRLPTGGFSDLAVPVNPCFNERSLTRRATDKALEWMPSLPSWGGRDAASETPATEEAPAPVQEQTAGDVPAGDSAKQENTEQTDKPEGWRSRLPKLPEINLPF